MYLSRLEVNPFRRKTMAALDSPQIMHACVLSSFPSASLQNDRVLWRIDKVGSATYLLVQSESKPDFSHLIDQMGWPSSGQQWETLDYEPFLNKLQNGQSWKFRLKANPVRRLVRNTNDSAVGKTVHHVTINQQNQWLIDRSAKNGFSIPNVPGCDSPSLEIKQRDLKQFNRNNNKVTVSMVTFEGVLTIEDIGLFNEAIRKGIGKAKAYGCGMITLARDYE